MSSSFDCVTDGRVNGDAIEDGAEVVPQYGASSRTASIIDEFHAVGSQTVHSIEDHLKCTRED